MIKEKMNYSGSFYPNDKNELLKYFDFFETNQKKIEINIKPKALIVPHAGYIYSGQTANYVYEYASKFKYKRVVVIGPSHRYYLDGASISDYDKYETPLGDLTISKDLVLNLVDEFSWLNFDDEAHMEHSTEVQMPFIKHYFDCEVVEIVYGKLDYISLSKLITKFLNDEQTLLVISTDLSHFHSQEKANFLDSICIEAINTKDLKRLDRGCEACGIIGVRALIEASIHLNLKIEFIDYSTSFNITKDESSVVGYVSFIIGV